MGAFGGGDILGALLGSAVASVVTGRQQAKEAKKARVANEKAAAETQAKADQDFNRLNQRKPDVGGLMSSNLAAASTGNRSTLLTGSAGIDQSALPLMRNTLLGQ